MVLELWNKNNLAYSKISFPIRIQIWQIFSPVTLHIKFESFWIVVIVVIRNVFTVHGFNIFFNAKKPTPCCTVLFY